MSMVAVVTDLSLMSMNYTRGMGRSTGVAGPKFIAINPWGS